LHLIFSGAFLFLVDSEANLPSSIKEDIPHTPAPSLALGLVLRALRRGSADVVAAALVVHLYQ